LLAVYVSGHGYGHATRTAEVLRAVRQLSPDLPILVATAAPGSLFEGEVAPPLVVRRLECDVGLAQKDALAIDTTATAERWRSFHEGWDRLVADEAERLREEGARLVLGDIPPLMGVVAAEAGLPSIALGNFSWDWIYAHLGRSEPRLQEAATFCREAYGRVDLLLRLPFAGDLSAFSRLEDVPLVARRPRVRRTAARRRLGLNDSPAVLLSFGGLGLSGVVGGTFTGLSDWQLIFTGPTAEAMASPDLRAVGAAELEACGLGYPDLVGAVDVVVTKPGYGIVSDCIASGTRIVYTDRGEFPEYPILVAGMAEHLPVAFVSNDDVRAGRIREAVESVLSRELPAPPDLTGAERAATRILDFVRTGGGRYGRR
jgi:hypothetical protein